MTIKQPKSVLFVCTMNAVRSPMAEKLAQERYGSKLLAVSAGVRAGSMDGFAESVMRELQLTLDGHEPITLEELDEGYFDLIVALSEPAHVAAIEFASDKAVDVEFWPIEEPSTVTGKREQVLQGYRGMRDKLAKRIKERFG